jgi:hypothetical protein
MRKKTVLIVVVILALGLIGTGLSTLYQRNEYIRDPHYDPKSMGPPTGTIKVFYGFPLAWNGYSQIEFGFRISAPSTYWFSLAPLLLDAAFWFAISFFVSFITIKSARVLNLVAMIRAGVLGMKTSIILLVMSLLFIFIGIGLCLFAQSSTRYTALLLIDWKAIYLDVGLRLIGSGTVTLIATLSVMLWKPSNARVRQGDADTLDSREV